MTDFTVGSLAARSGLTVRALHHYDAIGLLSPSGRTDAGYRLYSEPDVRKLQHIVLLKALGLSLPEIAAALSGQGTDLLTVIARHRTRLAEQIEEWRRLLLRLEHAAAHVKNGSDVSVDEVLEAIEATAIFDK